MMPSTYLTTQDLATYGLDAGTPDATVVQASAIVDFYLGRPEGLVWIADASGLPSYMAAAVPTMTFALAAPIAHGQNVPVTLTPAMATQSMIGDVLILDRGTVNTEACVISAVAGPGAVTLASVARWHAANATADQGLLITEDRKLPSNRSLTRVSRPNIQRIVSIQGRYGYGRRSDQITGVFAEINLLASVQALGGAPVWEYIDPANADFSPVTGDVWVPAGILLATFNEVRLRYVAGFSAANVPSPVRAATAQIVSNIAGLAGLTGTMTRITAGDTTIQRAVASNLDDDTKRMLAPYKVRGFY